VNGSIPFDAIIHPLVGDYPCVTTSSNATTVITLLMCVFSICVLTPGFSLRLCATTLMVPLRCLKWIVSFFAGFYASHRCMVYFNARGHMIGVFYALTAGLPTITLVMVGEFFRRICALDATAFDCCILVLSAISIRLLISVVLLCYLRWQGYGEVSATGNNGDLEVTLTQEMAFPESIKQYFPAGSWPQGVGRVVVKLADDK